MPEALKFKLLDNKQFTEFDLRIAPVAQDRSVFVEYPSGVFNIELTNRCPLKCVMCARTSDMTRAEGIMEAGLFRKIVDELASSNPEWSTHAPVRLHGFGESLVHPQFDEMIIYAEQQDVNTCLSMNPIVLTDAVATRLLNAAPSLLYMSMDGHDDASFERIRGLPHAYEKSKANLLRYLERKAATSCRTQIVLSMINFGLNEESIAIMRKYWESVAGIDEVRIKSFTTWDGNAEAVNRLAGITPATSTAPRKVTCRWPWRSVTVLWDGDVVPCCYDFDKRYSLGNMSSETLASIWNGVRMRALRAEFISGVVTNPLCHNCPDLAH